MALKTAKELQELQESYISEYLKIEEILDKAIKRDNDTIVFMI